MPYSNHEHWESEPDEKLRGAIRCFWYDRKDFGSGVQEFEVVPDGYAELIFYFGALSCLNEQGALEPLTSPFMIGLLNKPVLFFTSEELTILGIRCYPWTVFDLLGLPSKKGGVRAFDHPLAGLHSVLQERVQEREINEAQDILNHFFLSTQATSAHDELLDKAGAVIRKAQGSIPVSEIAEKAHATVRTLERRFLQTSGHTIKDVTKLIRFEQARNRLWIDPECSLAGLAYDLGYTDQSHLSREFKRFSGTTPAAFARKARKGQRVIASDFVAFVQS